MKTLNFQFGKKGEAIAADFLKKKGIKILFTNFQNRFGEIDLIGSQNQRLIFFEVKLKITDRFGQPEEMINAGKILKIQQTATDFLAKNPNLAKKFPQYQIDAVCVVLNPNLVVSRINHYENISPDLV